MIEHVIYKKQNQVSNQVYNGNGQKAGRLQYDGEVGYITFPVLEEIPYIKHGFSTRLGGVSKEHLSSMNLSFTRGDEEEYVRENYRRICKAIEMDPNDLVFSDQVHDTKIHVVTEKDRGKGYQFPRELVGIDGLITNIVSLPLVTYYADCVPLYFVDPVHKAIGLSHSGWKGTVHKMAGRTMEAMAENFGTKPEDVLAVIGPSICRDCYEVSEDVAVAFQKAYNKELAEQILEKKENGKYQLDLWLANKANCLEAGILAEKITISEICTCCNSELLFSHRASKGKRGNLAAFLSLA
ncbi:peptidoglycan editing factor PgeF [Anaerosporobacter faecicola]|uniref:peptidoglycan editing factor PgeF n=1 Tax=Anaerosporobacter faecicola TaxID=2718714 RepID=UPI00143AB665|nr:peptidoglycan editing factor PgeF [Anaerosporobacter faecicola]